MQVVLVMFRSDGERRSFSVVRNMTVIGRREDCDLRIPVGDVSRKHCRLVRTDDGIRIEDLGSSHGTFVNGLAIQEAELNPGDTIQVGPVQFVVQIDGVPEESEMIAPAADAGQADAAAAAAAGMVGDDDDDLVPQHPAAYADTVDETPAEGNLLAAASAEAEESDLDDIPMEEVIEAPAELEEVGELEEVPMEEIPAHPLAAADPDEVDELELDDSDEFAPVAAAGPETELELELEEAEASPAPPAAAAPDAEMELALEASEPEAMQERAPAAPVAAEEPGEWDFMVEEAESERDSADFHVDLDTPHPPR